MYIYSRIAVIHVHIQIHIRKNMHIHIHTHKKNDTVQLLFVYPACLFIRVATGDEGVQSLSQGGLRVAQMQGRGRSMGRGLLEVQQTALVNQRLDLRQHGLPLLASQQNVVTQLHGSDDVYCLDVLCGEKRNKYVY